MDRINASMVIEILGKPKEHVQEALANLIDKLDKERGVRVASKEVHEPVPAQDSKDLFTSFAEIEIKFDTVANYLGVLFAYMPSHVEIINPEKLTLQNTQLNNLGNILLQRLHQYDAITKKTIMDREFVLNRLKEVAPEEYKKITAPSEKQKKKKE